MREVNVILVQTNKIIWYKTLLIASKVLLFEIEVLPTIKRGINPNTLKLVIN